MPVPADNDVVMHGDAERTCDVDDRAGHLDVRLRWRRIAGRMIVHEAAHVTYVIDHPERRGSGFSCSCVTLTLHHHRSCQVALTHGRSSYSLVPRIKLVGRSPRNTNLRAI